MAITEAESFWDLVSKPADGSKSPYKGTKRGYAKVSVLDLALAALRC
jgi:hypothetical protein